MAIRSDGHIIHDKYKLNNYQVNDMSQKNLNVVEPQLTEIR